MCVRFETASGLRLYVSSRVPLIMTWSSHLGFSTEEETKLPSPRLGETIEILFDSITTAKHFRLNCQALHNAFKKRTIVPKSLFLHQIDIQTIKHPVIILTKDDFSRVENESGYLLIHNNILNKPQ